MITKKFLFKISTMYHGSEVQEEIELEFNETQTQEEIIEVVNEVYDEWLMEATNQSWEEVKEEEG